MGESGGMRREEGVSVPGKSLCSGGVAAGGGTEVPRTSIPGNQQRCRVKSRAFSDKGSSPAHTGEVFVGIPPAVTNTRCSSLPDSSACLARGWGLKQVKQEINTNPA